MATPHPSMRRGDFSLKGIVNYAKKYHQLFDGFRLLNDPRAANRSVRTEDAVSMIFFMHLLGYSSMNRFFAARISGSAIKKHCLLSGPDARIPSRDTAERIVAGLDPEELRELNWSMAQTARRSGTFKAAAAAAGGHSIGLIDGTQVYSSARKQCEAYCQVSHHRNGTESYAHKLVVLSTSCIGGSTGHFVLDSTLLKAGDPEKKAEGELTGAKRLLNELDSRMPGEFDIMTGDALYANAPFLNAVTERGRTAVVRIKGDDRVLIRQADELFDHGKGSSCSFYGRDRKGHLVLVTAHYTRMTMPGVDEEVLCVRFTETPVRADGSLDDRRDRHGNLRREEKTGYMICTDPELAIQTIWKIMHLRWDIEDSCFHVLSQDHHMKHLYSHKAAVQILILMLLAFNLRALHLFRFRGRDFVGRGYALWDFTKRLELDLHAQSVLMLLRRAP